MSKANRYFDITGQSVTQYVQRFFYRFSRLKSLRAVLRESIGRIEDRSKSQTFLANIANNILVKEPQKTGGYYL